MIGKTNVGGGGVRGIDYGEVTLASSTESVTVSHKLGVVPSLVALIPKTTTHFTSKRSCTLLAANDYALRRRLLASVKAEFVAGPIENTLTKNEITFNGDDTYPWYATDYYWVAIA